MQWTNDQRKIIDARNCNLLVSAAAGSGKTAVLVERLIEMIQDPDDPMDIDELLVVTFTKAAASQMKDKIAAALEKMLDEEPDNARYAEQLSCIGQAHILTIDSFCYQIVRDHFHVLGLDPSAHVGETNALELLWDETMEEIMEGAYQNPDFVQCADAFSADKNDEKMEEYIRRIYDISSSYPRPDMWVAQAKNSLQVTNEEQLEALPFFEAYREEMRAAVKGILQQIHLALAIVRSTDGPAYMEKALLSDCMLAEDVMAARTYTQLHDLQTTKFVNIGRKGKTEFDPDKAERVKELRAGYKEQMQNLLEAFAMPIDAVLEQISEQRPMLTALLDVTADFRRRFMEKKLKEGILEFSDVEHFALQILCDGYDDRDRPIPSAVGRELSEQFREILIDEYQDSNYLQEAILLCVSRQERNIFMVGDVKQSIYAFRMARPDLFMTKYHTYSDKDDADCRKLLLKNNFRSRPDILYTVNDVFYQIMGRDLGKIAYTEDEALIPGREFPACEGMETELLIGESKDFVPVHQADAVCTAEQKEELDENLEDIGKAEMEATMIAERMERMMGGHGEKRFQVTNDDGTLRDVTYGDMVILFRAPSAFSAVFQEVLMDRQIPVHIQNESGYFDAVEVRMLMSMLHVLDNPYDNVEMAAVMRGYFGNFTADELAVTAILGKTLTGENASESIPMVGRRAALYAIVGVLASDQESVWRKRLSMETDDAWESACKKSREMRERIETLRDAEKNMSTEELLHALCYETGYYYYVQAMPQGRLRARNLKLFMAEARRYAQGKCPTLYDFVRYMEKLQKKKISLGGDPSADGGENAVRIMSIHKSKGLEFPVVFLAGTGKNFNLQDSKTPLIVHADYYLGAKYVDTRRRCTNDTFARKAFASLMVTENIAEELRLLYVGMTRAKEKLILSGVTADIPALIQKHEMVLYESNRELGYSHVRTARNYLDFLTAAWMRNADFHAAMQRVPKRMDKAGEVILSAEYPLQNERHADGYSLIVHTYDFRTLSVLHVASDADRQLERAEKLLQWDKRPALYEKELEDRLNWTYPDESLTKQKSKLSVTEIRRLYDTQKEPADVVPHAPIRKQTFSTPRFIADDQKMDAALRGTWMHKAMELFDHANLTERLQIERFLQKMRENGRLPEETASFITADALLAFANSRLGERMRQAARKEQLYKEKQFVVGVPASRLVGKTGRDAAVVVQGIVDAYFREDDGLILVDYKTDRLRDGQEEVLVARYRTQMEYYRDTLEQLTGLPVREMYLYAFSLGKEILV